MCYLGTDAVWSGNPMRTPVGERMTGIDPKATFALLREGF